MLSVKKKKKVTISVIRPDGQIRWRTHHLSSRSLLGRTCATSRRHGSTQIAWSAVLLQVAAPPNLAYPQQKGPEDGNDMQRTVQPRMTQGETPFFFFPSSFLSPLSPLFPLSGDDLGNYVFRNVPYVRRQIGNPYLQYVFKYLPRSWVSSGVSIYLRYHRLRYLTSPPGLFIEYTSPR